MSTEYKRMERAVTNLKSYRERRRRFERRAEIEVRAVRLTARRLRIDEKSAGLYVRTTLGGGLLVLAIACDDLFAVVGAEAAKTIPGRITWRLARFLAGIMSRF